MPNFTDFYLLNAYFIVFKIVQMGRFVFPCTIDWQKFGNVSTIEMRNERPIDFDFNSYHR